MWTLLFLQFFSCAGSSPPGKKEPLPAAQPTLREAVGEGLSKERLKLFLQLGTAGGLMNSGVLVDQQAELNLLLIIRDRTSDV